MLPFYWFKVGILVCSIFVFRDQCFYMKLKGVFVKHFDPQTGKHFPIHRKGNSRRGEMIKFFGLIAHSLRDPSRHNSHNSLTVKKNNYCPKVLQKQGQENFFLSMLQTSSFVWLQYKVLVSWLHYCEATTSLYQLIMN